MFDEDDKLLEPSVGKNFSQQPTNHVGKYDNEPDDEENSNIQPILFEFPFQLKSFLRSLFQLKPTLISSYSIDKFRIVIENYVNDTNLTGKPSK